MGLMRRVGTHGLILALVLALALVSAGGRVTHRYSGGVLAAHTGRLAEALRTGGLAAVRLGLAEAGIATTPPGGRLVEAADLSGNGVGPATEDPAVRPRVVFLQPHAGVAGAPDVATLELPAPGGTFSVPYIQTGRDLAFSLAVTGAGADDRLEVILDAGEPAEQVADVPLADPRGTFAGVGFGEHTVVARILRAAPARGQLPGGEQVVARSRLVQVARGDVIAAMGDSTTEGVGDGPWGAQQLDNLAAFPDWLAAREAAARAGEDWVTADGRGFPQPSNLQFPGRSRPSFTVDLTRAWEAASGHPALILNLGFSGGTSDSYVHVVQSETLARELAVARPDAYLLDLGVNDAMVGRSPSDYRARLAEIVAGVESRFGAPPGEIHLACPIYAKQPARHAAEQGYLPQIEGLRASASLGAAPDLFSFYRDHPEDVADAVHPNAAGYAAMAELWKRALQGQGASC